MRNTLMAHGAGRLIGIVVAVLGIACSGKDGSVTNSANDPGEQSETPGASAIDAPMAAGGLREGITRAVGKPRLLGTMAYECDDGVSVVAQLDAETGGLWVFLPGQTVLLPHVPAESGSHYRSNTISVWAKGNQATIETPYGTRTCVEDRRRSVIEDAKLRGNDFWATGNEPGWTMEIGPEFTVLKTDYGQNIYTLRTGTAQVDAAARRTVYEGEVEGVAVRIVIEGVSCSDTMADTTYESKVTVSLDGQPMQGCGMALH